jgi:putative phosphoesterase
MRIACLADTHDRLPDHVTKAIAGADEIWHLGDVCTPSVIAVLQKLTTTVRVVRGNCDDHSAWPLTLDFKLAGHRFHLEHIPARVAPAGADFFLHGHTHVPRDETLQGVRFLNPGCITRPNRGAPASYAWLHLGARGQVEWRVILV